MHISILSHKTALHVDIGHRCDRNMVWVNTPEIVAVPSKLLLKRRALVDTSLVD